MSVSRADKGLSVEATRSGGITLRLTHTGGQVEIPLDEKEADVLEQFIAARRARPAPEEADRDEWRARATALAEPFERLFRAAEDVSESIIDPDRLSAPLRQLRERLQACEAVLQTIADVRESQRPRS